MARHHIASSIVLAGLLWSGVAAAEQSLPSDKQSEVESHLRSDGYSKWDEIGMADGVIKVDNAVDASGKKWDLQLDPKTMKVENKKAE